MERPIQYLTDNRERHLELLRELCRIPSISTQEPHALDVRKAVEWTRAYCERIGLRAQIFETARHPLVYAERCDAPGKPTYLVYGHVDVQPTGERSLWDADPFEPVVKDGWLICRGSADDKGQVFLHLRAAEVWLATEKKLPVNLKFLIEAEEEIGSPNLAPFVQAHRQRLQCDQVVISDTSMVQDGYPTITYGTRGLVYKEIKLFGPKFDLHSGQHGGAVPNPANILARIIASLHDRDGRVAIPGFYDDVRFAAATERRALAALPHDENEYFSGLGVLAGVGEVGFTTNERRMIRPTLDVNGIFGGYMKPGSNTIIPADAGAKLSMRLVPDQDCDRISALFDATIRARCPSCVRLEIQTHGSSIAYAAPLDSREMGAARAALRDSFGRDPAFLRTGGSLPILPMFKHALNADSLMLGFASPNCSAHGPNEKALLTDLDRGAEAAARLWAMLALSKWG